MAANISEWFLGNSRDLVGHVQQRKIGEIPTAAVHEMLLAAEERITALLKSCKAAPGPAGIVVTTCHSIIPFSLEDKIHLNIAQALVTTHWSKGAFNVQPRLALVERWMVHVDHKDWRVLCDEEAIIHSKHPNPIVSFMRMRQRPEQKLRLGDGGIFGDCVILNNKCGW